MTAPILSLVIPCYNESANLPHLIARIEDAFAHEDGRVEVILVDNGSADGSADILAGIGETHAFLRSVRVPLNQGYGYGILKGLAAARGHFLGWTHADMQTDPVDALAALSILETGSDGVFVKGKRHGRPLADTVFTVGMSVFETLLFRAPLWDINAQPTIFPRWFYEQWTGPPHDFSLDLFAYATAGKVGLQIHRIPVYFGDRLHGQSHWNTDWQAKYRFIRRTLEFSFRLKKTWKGQ